MILNSNYIFRFKNNKISLSTIVSHLIYLLKYPHSFLYFYQLIIDFKINKIEIKNE